MLNLKRLNCRYNFCFFLFLELNQDYEVRPQQKRIKITGNLFTKREPLKVREVKCYADHPLVVGQRYQPQDFGLHFANQNGGNYTSGVLVASLGDAEKIKLVKASNQVRVYELKGRFGFATANCMYDGKIIEKSTFKHVTEDKLHSVCARFQAVQQRSMFTTLGVHIQSQTAYEMASKGLMRPADRKTSPIIYSVKCLDFKRPDFTIEVQCVNEIEFFLSQAIMEIGKVLRTSAYCTSIRCTRFGRFTIDHALLEKHWTVKNIFENIELCKPLAEPEVLFPETPFLKNVADNQ